MTRASSSKAASSAAAAAAPRRPCVIGAAMSRRVSSKVRKLLPCQLHDPQRGSFEPTGAGWLGRANRKDPAGDYKRAKAAYDARNRRARKATA